jgi:hypothetical protein
MVSQSAILLITGLPMELLKELRYTLQTVILALLQKEISLKQSDSRSRRKKGAKTQPQGLREKTIWKRVST